MKRSLFLAFCCSLMSSAFAEQMSYVNYETVYEQNEVLHEMVIGCVATKKDCRTMAHHQGYNTSRTMKDAARCPQRSKALACIVKH